MKIIEVLLENRNVDLTDNFESDGLLAEIVGLIKEGCDVDAADEMGMTPLHIALTYSMLEVARELLEAGADVNAQDHFFEGTPLHHAVKAKSVEAVAMLLYYGADVNIVHCYDFTPFMYALDMDRSFEYTPSNSIEARFMLQYYRSDNHMALPFASPNADPHISDILYTLLDYYTADDLNYISKGSCSALCVAVRKGYAIAVDLVQRGADINCCCCDRNYNLLFYSLYYPNSTLFKLIWSRADHRVLIDHAFTPLLVHHLQSSLFSPSEWLECMYLILESPCAFDFVTRTIPYKRVSLISSLLRAFSAKHIPETDRVAILYNFLSYGVTANRQEIIAAYSTYGFGKEVDALLYAYDDEGRGGDFNLIPSFILVEEGKFSNGMVYGLLQKQIMNWPGLVQNLANAAGSFSLPYTYKDNLIRWCAYRVLNKADHDMPKQLEQVPEFASLVELSRNQARKFIKQACNVRKPYQFYDAVNRLKAPQSIKDIICFKKPIYPLGNTLQQVSANRV